MVIEQAFYKGGIKHLWDETSGRGIGLSPLIFDSMLVWNRGLDFKTFCEHKREEEANCCLPSQQFEGEDVSWDTHQGSSLPFVFKQS